MEEAKEITFMALDLEMNQPSGKIIQVGWCIGTIGGPIHGIHGCGSSIVNPNEELNPRIIQLTGITQEQVDKGVTLTEAYDELIHYHKLYRCFRNPLTWGGGDSATLRSQLGLGNEQFLFGRRWIDVKTIYQAYRISQGLGFQGGLAKSIHRVGGQFQGRKHDAENDARNTWHMFWLLLEKMRGKDES